PNGPPPLSLSQIGKAKKEAIAMLEESRKEESKESQEVDLLAMGHVLMNQANNPDNPPDAWDPRYCRAMLKRYKAPWSDAFTELDLDAQVRFFKNRWPKFCQDLQMHRSNELSTNPNPALEEDKVDQVECVRCDNMTSRPIRLVHIGENIIADGCTSCLMR
ncbi:MAG: hypothetical protein J4F46_09320, partial [Dehalococcoidia bacterium]|nr:hypothetical protein [Dehalococcoidia bacterium]